ncbi:TetR family transcriptional regulator [Mycobacterium sp. GA-2829]|uniref:TetR family transcriptional regulator n=1 Tax=Mycobacterium sp. GA-2829 TaxID=1772283 RepID=UPI00074017DE|nr:TetR family transcriptional regulator [Mycobacterium sp. GA-2829]KUI27604.1 TetR family transcriptional regulator [Mycobacterium sp. GA-2829]
MSSRGVAHITRLHDAHGRRTLTCRRVFSAAAALLGERADGRLSMPALAARAQVAPAAVTAHFPSVDAVLAELYLDRVTALPLVIVADNPPAARVGGQLRAVALVMADEPTLAAACSRALLSSDEPAVAVARDRIGAEVQRRIAAALGTGAWPEVQAALETLFWGALVQVQSCAIDYRTMADRLDTMLSLILPDTDG